MVSIPPHLFLYLHTPMMNAREMHVYEMQACEMHAPLVDVFQSVHLRGVHLISGRISQGVPISWACAS